MESLIALAWPIIFICIIVYLRKSILGIAEAVKMQISNGASIKFKGVELVGKVLSDFGSAKKLNGENQVYLRDAATKKMADKRHQIYTAQQNIFLTHRVLNSGDFHKTNGLRYYDLSIYLIIHKTYGALNNIKKVEYYFGEYFGNDDSDKYGTKYTVLNSMDGFAIKTRAYGPMLCVATVYYHDGSIEEMHRYIDFEGTDFKFSANAIKDEATK